MERDLREKDEIVVEFTEELLKEWTKRYMKKHPKTKKKPIQFSNHPSLNTWIILRRPMMNALKQKWANFTEFVVDYYGLRDLGISKCKCKYIVFKDSRRRSDVDNYSPKFIFDGFSAEHSGLIIDDSSDCIEELTIKIEYRKGQRGGKFIFYNCEYDKKLLEDTKKKEMAKTEKRQATMEENKLKNKSRRKTKK